MGDSSMAGLKVIIRLRPEIQSHFPQSAHPDPAEGSGRHLIAKKLKGRKRGGFQKRLKTPEGVTRGELNRKIFRG